MGGQPSGRAARAIILGALAVVALLLPSAGAAELVLSLTFDDTLAEHFEVGKWLAQHGMRGTFLVNAPRIDRGGYLSLEEILHLQAGGHEIGGHTLGHKRLGELEEDDQLREICDDRERLLSLGLAVRAFAFPFNSHSAFTLRAIESCGYDIARGAAGIWMPGTCAGCPITESIPPEDPLRLRTLPSYREWMGTDSVQEAIERASTAGEGWLILVFHDICDGGPCSQYGIAASEFRSLLGWIARRGIQVRTLSEVLPGSVRPPVSGPPRPLPGRVGANLLRNPSFQEDLDGDGFPDCWIFTGTDEPMKSGRWIESGDDTFARLSAEELQAGDLKLLSDEIPCSPDVVAGLAYTVSIRYRLDSQARIVAYVELPDGTWKWWAQGPRLPKSKGWDRARWTTPPIPPGVSAVRVGVSLRGQGWLDVDEIDLRMAVDDGGSSSCSAAAPLPLLSLALLLRALRRLRRGACLD